jgi:manganese-dependent ADP-ribose/CDP-alcohol diphosphatase
MKSTLTRRRFIGQTAAAAAAPWLLRGAGAERGFSFGLVADAQYADVPDKGTRHYRASIAKLATAVAEFQREELAFCVHLGDLIDRQWRSFAEISRPLAPSRHRWYHLLGNHDFEVLDEEKSRVATQLAMPARYYSFDHDQVHFVVLDTNDISTYAHPAGSGPRQDAERALAAAKQARLPQAQPWNGAVGPTQLEWFERSCGEARRAGQRVIILAHHPVLPAGPHVLWNAPAVLAVIDRCPNVVAWLNGHNHSGAFAARNGVPYVTLHGMVETAQTNAFATAQLLSDRLILHGRGREPSRELTLRLT